MKYIELKNDKLELFQKFTVWFANNVVNNYCVLFTGHFQDKGFERFIIYYKEGKGYKLSWVCDANPREIFEEFMPLETMFEVFKKILNDNCTDLYCRKFIDSLRISN